ncbi:MAG: outer membrane beta-barrel protein [Flavobacteriales bacterium]
MKKASLIALVTLLPAFCSAQGGSWYVGGVAGFSSSSNNQGDNEAYSSWSLAPEVGTYFNARWSAGIALGMSGTHYESDISGSRETTVLQPVLYVRRWCPVGDRFSLFTGLDLSGGVGRSTITPVGQPHQEVSYNGFGANLNAGVTYALADRWTLMMKFAALGYNYSKNGSVTTNEFRFLADGNVLNSQFVNVGLYYTFKKAKSE